MLTKFFFNRNTILHRNNKMNNLSKNAKICSSIYLIDHLQIKFKIAGPMQLIYTNLIEQIFTCVNDYKILL